MKPETIHQVQSSWAQVQPIAHVAGPLFYRNLFEADPSLRPLFRGDTDAQAARLMQMIGVAVSRLDDLPALVPVLKQLGQRHQGYGVRPAHYDTVGNALLATLEQGLGPAFTPAVRTAWTTVYGVMAEVMQTAAAMNATNEAESLPH
jgi:methyl-accepting chemotaxis protein